MSKIHRFQLDGKLQVAARALGLSPKTLLAAVEPLLDIQEPRLYELKLYARDFKHLTHAPKPRWRFIWKVPDGLRDSGFNAREARFGDYGLWAEILILSSTEVVFDFTSAPVDVTLPIEW